METLIGIDFGTTNSVVCILEGFNAHPIASGYKPIGEESAMYEFITPTVLAINSEGRLFHGLNAKKSSGKILLSLKRILGNMDVDGHESKIEFNGKWYFPSQLASYFFKRLRYNCELQLGMPVTKAVITIPSNSKGPQRFLTRYAAQKAGFEVVTLINEPTAAAVSYSMGLNYSENDEKIFLVYDFGGGTFDVTLLKLTGGMFYEVGSNGIRKLGGDDFDELLVQLIQRKTKTNIPPDTDAYIHFRIACENAKIALSSQETINFSFTQHPWNINCVVTRSEFEKEILPLVTRTAEKIETVIMDYKNENRSARNKTPGEFIDHILLVGGSSKIPLIQKFVAEFLKITPEQVNENDPMLCVAKGAAITNGIFHQQLPFDYHVKLEHSLCTYLVRRPGKSVNNIRDAFETLLLYLKNDLFIKSLRKLFKENEQLLDELAGEIPEKRLIDILVKKLEDLQLQDISPTGLVYLWKFLKNAVDTIMKDQRVKDLVRQIDTILKPGNFLQDIHLLQQALDMTDQLLNLFTEHQLDPLIIRGSSIPIDSKPIEIGLDYKLIEGMSDHYVLPIYEGNEYEYPHHSDNFPLNNLRFEIPGNADRNTYRVILTYCYGADGILTIKKSSSYEDKYTHQKIEEPETVIPIFIKSLESSYPLFKIAQEELRKTRQSVVPVHYLIDIENALLYDDPDAINQSLNQINGYV